jgi:hypothetical protein
LESITPDLKKVDALLGPIVEDLGAVVHGATVVLGEKLGPDPGLNVPEGRTSAELATATSTAERFVREWLAAQLAPGHVRREASSGRFYLTPEQAFVLPDERGPADFPGAFVLASATYRDVARRLDAHRTGKGVGWHPRDETLFIGTSQFFRPS